MQLKPALLSLYEDIGLGKRQMDEVQKRNIFIHVQTKKLCVSETSELTKRQLFAQTENKMMGDKASNKISKLCVARRLCWKMALLSLCECIEMEKRLLGKVQKRNTIRHNLTKTCISETNELAERQLCAQNRNRCLFKLRQNCWL